MFQLKKFLNAPKFRKWLLYDAMRRRNIEGYCGIKNYTNSYGNYCPL